MKIKLFTNSQQEINKLRISGYCSNCFEYTEHKFVKYNKLSRDVFQCLNCKSKTIKCRLCNNFAKTSTKKFFKLNDFLCAEHDGSIANFKYLNVKLQNLDDYHKIFKRDVINIKKVSKISVATVAGVAVISPLAFIAAPAIGGALGTIMGLSGAAATNAGLAAIGGGAIASGGLGISGGALLIAATGAALGGTLGGVISNNYFGEIEGFEIKKIKEGKGNPILFIDGFLTQENEDTTVWEKQLKQTYPNNPWYYVKWESKRLHDLGKKITEHGTKKAIEIAITQFAKQASKSSLKKLTPFGYALTALGIINNPWSIACVKASMTGVLLADLLSRTEEKYILCGHSLGARVIYYTLKTLSKKNIQFVDTVHLLGGAVDSNPKDWSEASKAVSKNIINYSSKQDYVLATMYKLGTFFTSKPIGRNIIEAEKVINIDTTNIVNGHTQFKNEFAKYAICK